VQSATDADAGVRRTAVEMVGAIGEAPQSADLVRLLQQTQGSTDREDLERALLAICRRSRTECLPQISPLVRKDDTALRTIGLHAMGAIGGPQALAVVTSAVNDPDQTIQDEAVNTLSSWPSSWPDDAGVVDPLLALAKSGKKMSHRVKAMRGYLQYVQENKTLSNTEKLAKVNELLPLIQRPEEKRLVIATVSTIPSAGSLDLLMTFADDPAVAEEACQPIVKIAAGSALAGGSTELRRKALQKVVDKSTNDATRKKAEDGLKRIR
jgi:HEAT repeat protein